MAGFLSKKNYIQIALNDFKNKKFFIDVICLSETFIKRGDEKNMYLPNYTLVSWFSRRDSRRGGVGIFVCNGIECKNLNLDGFVYELAFECCAVEITQLKCTIVCIYRIPSNKTLDIFLNSLEQLLLKLTRRKNCNNIILTGDFNIDILKSTSD